MDNLIFNPGFYTKVRLNQSGDIIDASQLEKDDLPTHIHDLKDITGDLKGKIVEVLSTFFANTEDSAVEFSFDPLTATVSADIKIDDDTVYKNEFGQLEASRGEIKDDIIETPSATHTISLNDVKREVYEVLSKAFTNNGAVIFDWDAKTGTFDTDVKFDGITISKNLEGELQSMVGEEGSISANLDCATHTHTVAQIKDFEQGVKELLEKYGNLGIDTDTLKNFIDNKTIIFNEYGQLTSVSTVVGKHTHVLKDITDYKEPDPAAKQKMIELGSAAVYDSGVLDFTELNIGYSILALSQYLKDVVNKNITSLNTKIKQLSADVNNGNSSLFIPHRSSLKNILYDKNNSCYREVYYAQTLQLTLDFLPKTEGTIELYINNALRESVDVSQLYATGISAGIFKVESSYYKNFNLVKVLKIDVREFIQKEGLYTFKLKYVTDTAEDNSSLLSVYVSPYKALSYAIESVTKTHTILTTKYYPPIQMYKYKISINNYRNYRFINDTAGFRDGILFGYTDDTQLDLSVPNLFEETKLSVDFPYEQEESTSTLYSYITDIVNAVVVNDVLTPINGASYTVVFTIPHTEQYNALKIWGISWPGCSIYKTKQNTATDVKPAVWPNTSGYIRIDNSCKLLWLAGYDKGTENINLMIEGLAQINLKDITIEPCIIN